MADAIKVGVFVDAENIRYNGGYQMRYDVLRRFAARDGGILLRLNTYITFDQERAREDQEYAERSRAFQQMVRDFGWKITVKPIRRYTDDEGNVNTKANADLDLAVDAMLQADNLDQIRFAADQGFTAWEDNGMMGRDPNFQEQFAKVMAERIWGKMLGRIVLDGWETGRAYDELAQRMTELFAQE